MRDFQEKDIPTVKSLDGLIRLLQRARERHRSRYHCAEEWHVSM